MSMRDGVKVVFKVIDSQVTRLEVSRETSPFGLKANVGFFSHHLGYRDEPLYHLQQPTAPTWEDWIIHPLSTGRVIPPQQDFAQGMDPAYLDRFEGSGVCQGFDIPWLLPSGSYLMIQSSRRPKEVERMLMGNGWVSAPPNVRALSQERDEIYSCVFGADPQRPPSFDQPLVGFVLLNSNGGGPSEEVFFFNFLKPLPGAVLPAQELMLIVPVEGELVFNNYANPDERTNDPYLEEWKTSLVHKFAAWCTAPFAGWPD